MASAYAGAIQVPLRVSGFAEGLHGFMNSKATKVFYDQEIGPEGPNQVGK